MNQKNTLPNLEQYEPLEIWRRQMRAKRTLWILCLLIEILLLIILSRWNNGWWILFLLVSIVFIGLTLLIWFDLHRSLVAMNWDEFELINMEKLPFHFQSKAGDQMYAYIYIPHGINLERLVQEHTPLKTVIGLHGWGSHHREMDRYCIPTCAKEKYLYFTYDAIGQGLTPGDKSDFRQIDNCREFIDTISALPYVNREYIMVIGMSLGAAKASVAAYPHPDVRGLIMMSGAYDLMYTKKSMKWFERLVYKLSGFRFPDSKEELQKYSGINYFQSEGIVLRKNEQTQNKTLNKDRVFIMANKNDPIVVIENSLRAIEKLQLPEDNYRIFTQGQHIFQGNEYWVAVEINYFVRKIMNL